MSAGCRPAALQCGCHRHARAQAFGVRRRHVVGIARFARAQQQHGIGVEAVGRALEQDEGGRLADREAVAVRVVGAAGLGREQLQRIEAVQGGEAQGIDAADDGGVDQAGGDHPRGRGEHLGARRAGGGDHHGRPFQIEGGAHEIGHRIGVVRGAIVEIVRQGAGRRVAAAVGLFGLQDAGGAGAEQHAHPPAAVARGGRADGGIEAILAAAPGRRDGCCGIRIRRGWPAKAPRPRRPLRRCTSPGRSPSRRRRALARSFARAGRPVSAPGRGPGSLQQ